MREAAKASLLLIALTGVGVAGYVLGSATEEDGAVPATTDQKQSWGIVEASPQPYHPTWPTWPAAIGVNVEGGELVFVLATAVPTELPTATPGVVPTSTPLLPDCKTAVPGQTCEWVIATFTPSPIPTCNTPKPGGRCVWPTNTPEARVTRVGNRPVPE